MAWLFIFPGDWHIELPESTNRSVLWCWAQEFSGLIQLVLLLSVLTTFCWRFRKQYAATCSEISADTSNVGILDYMALWLKSFPPSSSQEQCHRNLKEMTDDVGDTYAELLKQDTHNPTWKICKDCLAYILMYNQKRKTGIWEWLPINSWLHYLLHLTVSAVDNTYLMYIASHPTCSKYGGFVAS